MVMLSKKNTPFSVIYKIENRELKINCIYDNLSEFYDNLDLAINIDEDSNVQLNFSCNIEDAKLFMDGLDSVSISSIKEDDKGPYINPTNRFIDIFHYNSFPLIPGTYVICVIINNRKYYSGFKVKARHISENQLVIMKSETEKLITELANEVINNNYDLLDESINIPIELNYFGFIIKTYSDSLIGSINDIILKFNHKLKKNYNFINSDKIGLHDERSINMYNRKPIISNKIIAPVYEIDYDLPENRMLKRMVKCICSRFREIKDLYEKTIEGLQEDQFKVLQNELKILHGESLKIINACEKFLNNTNVKLISTVNANKFNHVTFHDPRYSIIYNIFKRVEGEFKVSIDSKLLLNFKRTAKLYEIWGFTKIIHILKKELNFLPVKGWVFNNLNNSNVIVSNLNSNTVVEMVKEDLTIKLHFDKQIPYSSTKTDLDNSPLYTIDVNNRPDVRLDFYRNNSFLGSIVMDFKFRKISSIWDNSKTEVKDRPTTMLQLTRYYTGLMSKYLLDNTNKMLRPVYEVWAFFPNNNFSNTKEEYIEDYRLRLLCLRPGEDNQHISENIRNAIGYLCK
jgi:hypothetical protein